MKKIIACLLSISILFGLAACGSSDNSDSSSNKNEPVQLVCDITKFANITSAELVELLGKPNEIAETTPAAGFVEIPCTYYDYYGNEELGDVSFILINDRVAKFFANHEFPYDKKDKLLTSLNVKKSSNCVVAADTATALRFRCLTDEIDDLHITLIDGDTYGFLAVTYDMLYFEEWYLPMSISEQSNYCTLTQNYVKSILKSPKSADFPSITQWAIVKNNFYIATQAYVDAMNSFGAEIRSKFTFIYPVGASTPIYAVFDGEKIIDNGYVETADLVKQLVDDMSKEVPNTPPAEQVIPDSQQTPTPEVMPEPKPDVTPTPTPEPEKPEQHSHSYGLWKSYDEAKHVRPCSSCNESEYETHNWDSGTITQAASCSQKGTVTYSCSVCKAEKYDSIPKVEHKWNEGMVTQEVTCAREGVITYSCSVCKTEKYDNIPKVEHKWDDGAVTQSATCAQDGVMTYSCAVCQVEKYGSIPKTAHEFVQKVEDSRYLHSRATFTNGSAYYYSCVCGEKGADTFSLDDKKEWISAEQLEDIYHYGWAWMGEYIWIGRTDYSTRTEYNFKIYGSPERKMESDVIYEGNMDGKLVRFKNSKVANYSSANMFFYYDDLVAAGII